MKNDMGVENQNTSVREVTTEWLVLTYRGSWPSSVARHQRRSGRRFRRKRAPRRRWRTPLATTVDFAAINERNKHALQECIIILVPVIRWYIMHAYEIRKPLARTCTSALLASLSMTRRLVNNRWIIKLQVYANNQRNTHTHTREIV